MTEPFKGWRELAQRSFSMAKSAIRTARMLKHDHIARQTWRNFAADDLRRALDYRETAKRAAA